MENKDLHGFNIVNYHELIPRNGFVFRFIKKDNDYIHTFVEGSFITDTLTPTAMVVGHTLLDFLPKKQALQKLVYYERAWDGDNVTYEGNIDDVHYVASLNPIEHDGEVVEVIGTAFDITDQKRNEAKIQELEKLSVVGELAAGIAHEIRNPLTSLIGFTQILKERANDDPMQSYLGIMMDELDRINDIIDKFMFIAQPDKTVEIKVYSINSIISNVIESMEKEFALKGISIEFDDDTLIRAECDRSLITKVLQNLIQNALEATEQNSEDIKISLKDISEKHYLIQITDKGSGMTNERLKKIFEPFYTTKEKGTGLGLMINRRIIQLHQGIIDFKSEVGKGTEVKITLPKTLN
ncbi:nitrogen regulation protein NR(II) [Peribacillus sp. NPDC097295]|uniref:two-component system sensor histidine kinase NtrB n=1 Tax=Peribacillus sp. NPDC097295 TaxID=3364402 RepID=UPI00382FC41A